MDKNSNMINHPVGNTVFLTYDTSREVRIIIELMFIYSLYFFKARLHIAEIKKEKWFFHKRGQAGSHHSVKQSRKLM